MVNKPFGKARQMSDSNISLLNMPGQTVFTLTCTAGGNNATNIQISMLPTGIYIPHNRC